MRHTDKALRSLADSLADVIVTGDQERLRAFLLGRTLPALGGDLSPSESLRQALYLRPDVQPLAKGLAALLAMNIHQEVRSLSKLREGLHPAQRRFLLEVFSLAGELPAQTELFGALYKLLSALRHLAGKKKHGVAPLLLPLWQALAYQQTDSTLEPEWHGLLQSTPGAEWTAGRRTLLLVAWQGLLWVPPADEAAGSAEVVDFERIEQGLLALTAAVRGQEEAEDLLREALEVMRDTFPRSGEFWEEHLRPRMGAWPAELRERTLEVWPGLQSFVWHSAGTAGSESLSVYWRSLAQAPPGAESPLDALFSTESEHFWEGVDSRIGASWARKLTKYLASNLVLQELARLPHAPTPEGVVEIFAGSLLLHQLYPEPDLFRLAGGTAIAYPAGSPRQSDWRVLEPPPSFTHFPCEEADATGDATATLPKAWAASFQRDLAHKALAVLSQFTPLERRKKDLSLAFQQIEGQALALRNSLNAISALQAPMARLKLHRLLSQQVQHQCRIHQVPDLQPATGLHLSFIGPAPEKYLRDLSALPIRVKGAALSQLRRALRVAWNPLERLYLQAVIALMALQEADFLRALQELAALKRIPSTVEHQVLMLHAKAGAGERKSCVRLFVELEQKDLSEPAQKTLSLLDDAYGLSGRETTPDRIQYEKIIWQEAAMIEASSSHRAA